MEESRPGKLGWAISGFAWSRLGLELNFTSIQAILTFLHASLLDILKYEQLSSVYELD